ncbi:MAG: hypothetical protein R3Y11_02100 [Pseudomonadota bacterium]
MAYGDVHNTWAQSEEKNTAESCSSIVSLWPSGAVPKNQSSIATVNGHAISLEDLLTAHGTSLFITNTSLPQSVDELRAEYALVLRELITYELIRQELEACGFMVTDMEIQQAEQEIRATYTIHDELETEKRRQAHMSLYGEIPEYMGDFENIDSFSTNLIEQGMTLAQWRAMLARQVAKRTFMDNILKPRIHLDIAQIEEAYHAHPELITLEKRVQCQLFTANSFNTLTELRDALKKQNQEQLSAISGYIVEDFLLPYARLPLDWAGIIDHAETFFGEKNTGQYLEFITENDEQKLLLVHSILPARTLTLGEAYVRLERLLMEQRLAIAFDAWLEQAWQNADVRLIPQLFLGNSHHFETIDE